MQMGKNFLNIIEQGRLKDFVNTSFKEVSFHQRDGRIEGEFICPWCEGGRKNRITFHLNVSAGVGHCFRASCGYRKSAAGFIADYKKISFKQALDYLRGDSDLASYTEATITSYKQMVESSYADLNLSSFVSADIVGMIDLEDSPNKYEVYDWIERDRKYDLDWFLNYFKMYMPPEGIYEGYVAFSVETEDSEAYQLYSYSGHSTKTLNPPDSILSSMIFNWNKVKDEDGVLFCSRRYL